jgi:hypothetical protein
MHGETGNNGESGSIDSSIDPAGETGNNGESISLPIIIYGTGTRGNLNPDHLLFAKLSIRPNNSTSFIGNPSRTV